MAYYRGVGGAGDATNDASISQVTEAQVAAEAAATNAAASASSAATSAASASASSSSASSSASSASNSATTATAASTSAIASFDAFDDRYLGAKASDPITDNDGDVLIVGALYWNSVAGEFRAWDGSAWQSFNGLPSQSGNSGKVLTTDGTVATWEVPASGNVVDDTTPQLGGNLDVNGFDITSSGGGNVEIYPDTDGDVIITAHGTGVVSIEGNEFPDTYGTSGQVLTTDGAGVLSWATLSSDLVNDTSPQLGGALDTNGYNITFANNVKTRFGSPVTFDLFSTGTTTYLSHVGSGDCYFHIPYLKNFNMYEGSTLQNIFQVDANAATKLFYDKAEKLATSSTGISVTGEVVTTGGNSTDWQTAYGWGNHALAGYLTSFTETNNLTSAVTWANVPDANITQSSVTQHQAALSITESQISDLQSYLTATSTIDGGSF